MKYTDENGAEYEYVGEITGTPANGSIIRPVKQEPRWDYRLSLESMNILSFDSLFDETYELTEHQAQKIKEAVEALMNRIFVQLGWEKELAECIDKARQSLKDKS